MIKTAYLRIYQPLASFPSQEREQWMENSREVDSPEPATRRWLIAASLPDHHDLATPTEGAFVRERDGVTLIMRAGEGTR